MATWLAAPVVEDGMLAGNSTAVLAAFTNGTEQTNSNLAYTEATLQMIYISIGIIGLVGNGFVIIVIFNYTAMRKKITNIFIINQSFTDVASSLCVLCQGVFTHPGKGLAPGLAGELLCSLWLTRAPLWSLLMSSTYNLLALTVERYLEVVHPVWHKNNFSPRLAYWTIAAVWVLGPMYNFAYLVPTSRVIDGECLPFGDWPSEPIQNVVGILTVLLQYILPIVVMVYCYTRMALVVHRRIVPSVTLNGLRNFANKNNNKNKRVCVAASDSNLVSSHQAAIIPKVDSTHSLPPHLMKATRSNIASTSATITGSTHSLSVEAPTSESSNSNSNSNNNIEEVSTGGGGGASDVPMSLSSRVMMKARTNIIKMLVIVCVCYILCWTWNEIFFLLYCLGRPTDFSSDFYHFTVVAVFANCCVNPFIYLAKYREFQIGIKKLCGRLGCGGRWAGSPGDGSLAGVSVVAVSRRHRSGATAAAVEASGSEREEARAV